MRRLLASQTGWYALGLALIAGVAWLESVHPGGISLPDLTAGLITLDLLIRAGIFTIVLVGLNLLMGYAGQVSLGQAAFYGMGAFFSAILTVRAQALGLPAGVAAAWWWPWVLMPAGALVVGAVAFLIGRAILRLQGHYLAVATLGLGIVIYIVLRENLGLPGLNLTGGFDGVSGIQRLRIGGLILWPAPRYFVLVWLVALGAIALGVNIVHSRFGRVLQAIHGSEPAAESLGVSVATYKAMIFALSAALAAVAGSLYAHFQAAVVPATFGFVPSLELVVMSAVGGMASIWGAPLGALALLLLREILRTYVGVLFPARSGELEAVAFGFLLVIVMMFWPAGLVSSRVWRRRAAGSVP